MPETLPEWIAADGLTHLKIKLNGDNLEWDVDRVVAIERTAAEAQAARGCEQWCYSADFNEKCANVDYVLDFLAQVGERAPDALRRLQYIEQPTHRDLRANPENRMHRAAKIKPVVIDESLVDFESLLLSRELGYSGVALKACKGHSRGPADGRRRAEVQDVPLRPGPYLSGLFVPALGQPLGKDSHDRRHRRQQPAILSGRQYGLGRTLSLDVPRQQRHDRHGRPERTRTRVLRT